MSSSNHLNESVIEAAMRAAQGFAALRSLSVGITEAPDSPPSVLLLPKNGGGWDCIPFEEEFHAGIERGIRVFANGYALESWPSPNGQPRWHESPLSQDARQTREHMQEALARYTSASSHNELSETDVEVLEAQGWCFAIGRKDYASDNRYTPATGEPIPVKGDLMGVIIHTQDGEPVPAVAWYDHAAKMRTALLDASRYPNGIREAATALAVYVDTGCREDLETFTQQLALGKELFDMLEPDWQQELREEGVAALQDVLIRFASFHGSDRQRPNFSGPGMG